MISSEVISLVLNKYVLGGLSVFIGLVIAYFKGADAVKKANEAKRVLEERAQLARIRSAEAKNQFLQQKGQKTNEEITTSDSIDSLIRLFDSLKPEQGKSTDADKKRD